LSIGENDFQKINPIHRGRLRCPSFYERGEYALNKLLKYKICGMIDTSVTGKLLYLMLDELSDENGEIIISQRKIYDALHISRSAVSRNLRRLRRAGAINIIPTYHSDGGRSANKYFVK
jgi:hypothetical protein